MLSILLSSALAADLTVEIRPDLTVARHAAASGYRRPTGTVFAMPVARVVDLDVGPPVVVHDDGPLGQLTDDELIAWFDGLSTALSATGPSGASPSVLVVTTDAFRQAALVHVPELAEHLLDPTVFEYVLEQAATLNTDAVTMRMDGMIDHMYRVIAENMLGVWPEECTVVYQEGSTVENGAPATVVEECENTLTGERHRQIDVWDDNNNHHSARQKLPKTNDGEEEEDDDGDDRTWLRKAWDWLTGSDGIICPPPFPYPWFELAPEQAVGVRVTQLARPVLDDWAAGLRVDADLAGDLQDALLVVPMEFCMADSTLLLTSVEFQGH